MGLAPKILDFSKFWWTMLPSADNTFDLGSSTKQFRSIYFGTSIVWSNATMAGKIATATNLVRIGNTSNHAVYLISNNVDQWSVDGSTASTSTLSALQATARIVGGATNGLAIRNSGNTRDNLAIADAGSSAILSDGTRTSRIQLSTTSGEITGGVWYSGTSSATNGNVWLAPDYLGGTAATKAGVGYYNATQWYSALEVANVASGFGTLDLMKSGGNVTIGSVGNTAYIFSFGNGAGASVTTDFRMYGGSGHKTWSLSNQTITADALTFTPSTANGGATFTTPVFTIFSAGGAQVNGSLTSSSTYSGDTGNLGFVSRGYFSASADGVWRISNNAGTDFTRLQFGGTTNAFPAIKRNAAALNFRLADDSADAAITASTITASKAMVETISTVTYSASMTPDASLGNHFVITITNGTAFTINAPSNPTTGQCIEFRLKNTSGGAAGVATWNAVFKMTAWTQPATGNSRSIQFRYDGTNWIEIGRTSADVPN